MIDTETFEECVKAAFLRHAQNDPHWKAQTHPPNYVVGDIVEYAADFKDGRPVEEHHIPFLAVIVEVKWSAEIPTHDKSGIPYHNPPKYALRPLPGKEMKGKSAWYTENEFIRLVEPGPLRNYTPHLQT